MILLLLLLGLHSTYADVRLNVSIISKKGIDKGLILISELHSSEVIVGKEKILIQNSEGVNLRLGARLVDRPHKKKVGPWAYTELSGIIRMPDGTLIKEFTKKNKIVAVGEEKKITFKASKDQELEIHIRPEVN